MPPIRSYPAIKPLKTERSHEENQERAYIAASRRSDRSLEARIESARRASEIHKRRTGRALRVTESDVVNEEMYEEEDDDLPLKYRRLTAHLNGTASDFNRRLAAFVTNQVAMRSALDQAVSGNSADQQSQQPQQQPWSSASPAPQPNVLQWMQQQRQQLLQAQSQTQSTPQAQFMPPMVSPDALHRVPNADFRQAPCPSSTSGTSSPVVHNKQQAGPQQQNSASAQPHYTPTLSTQRSNSDSNAATTLQPTDSSSQRPTTMPTKQTQQSSPWSAPTHGLSFSPSGLSTTLPMDAQMFLGSPFNMADFNDRAPNSSDVKQPSYNFNPSALYIDGSKAMFEGMNQTLAPGAFENTYDSHTSWMNDSESKLFDLDNTFENTCSNTPSGQATPHIDGQSTPADDFAAFIDSSAYEETPA